MGRVKLEVGKAREMVPQVGRQERLDGATQPPEVRDLDQQRLSPEQCRGGRKSPYVAELHRQAECRRPNVVGELVRLPAQLRYDDRGSDARRDNAGPAARSTP